MNSSKTHNRNRTAQPTGDRTLDCARCGIAFLWTVEEQARVSGESDADGGAPVHCPGCRRLLPGEGRERGLVKWFNRRKRFGFIHRQSGDDVFVHGSRIDGARSLQPGALVEFAVVAGGRGPEARAVQRLAAPAEEGNEGTVE